jgi:hypothetical protein
MTEVMRVVARAWCITCYGFQNGWEFQNAFYKEIVDIQHLILGEIA